MSICGGHEHFNLASCLCRLNRIYWPFVMFPLGPQSDIINAIHRRF